MAAEARSRGAAGGRADGRARAAAAAAAARTVPRRRLLEEEEKEELHPRGNGGRQPGGKRWRT